MLDLQSDQYHRDRRFLRPQVVYDQFRLHTSQAMRWRRHTGIDPRQEKGQGHHALYTGREVHQMLAYLDVVGHHHSSGGQRIPVEDLRWVWEPLMLAIATNSTGGMLVAWRGDYAVTVDTQSAVELATKRGGLVAIYNFTMPTSLDTWLRDRWAERDT